MFIKTTKSGYNRYSEHFAFGWFLVLLDPDTKDPESPQEWRNLIMPPGNYLRAAIVYTRLGQFGQFMMGRASFAGHKMTLSGTYGHDGLSFEVPYRIWLQAVPLPDELFEAWSKGGGWNSAGNEGEAMRSFGTQIALAQGKFKRERRKLRPIYSDFASYASDYPDVVNLPLGAMESLYEKATFYPVGSSALAGNYHWATRSTTPTGGPSIIGYDGVDLFWNTYVTSEGRDRAFTRLIASGNIRNTAQLLVELGFESEKTRIAS